MSYLIYLVVPLLLIVFYKEINKKKFTPADFITMLVMVAICGFRYQVGQDYELYSYMFDNVSSFERVEIFFEKLIVIMNSMGLDNRSFFFICALIITVVTYTAIKKNSKYPAESLFLYVCLGFYAFQFNVIRQSLAIAIILISFKYMQERKLFRYLIGVIIASLCHTTALIMLPVYFFVNVKWSRISQLVILAILFVVSFGYTQIIELVASYFPMYEVYLTEDKYTFDEAGLGTYVILFINLVMYILILLNKNKLINYNIKNKVFINLVLLSFVFYFLGLNNTVMIRPAYYMFIYTIFVLPDLYRVSRLRVSTKNSMIMVPCFIAYYMIHLHFFNEMIPYNCIFFR